MRGPGDEAPPSDFQPPRTVRSFCCVSHPVCGILLRQPKLRQMSTQKVRKIKPLFTPHTVQLQVEQGPKHETSGGSSVSPWVVQWETQMP